MHPHLFVGFLCSSQTFTVLDLACGKTGDIGKWMRRGVTAYVGVDIAKGSLEDAVIRLNRMDVKIPVRLACADLGVVRTGDGAAWQ